MVQIVSKLLSPRQFVMMQNTVYLRRAGTSISDLLVQCMHSCDTATVLCRPPHCRVFPARILARNKLSLILQTAKTTSVLWEVKEFVSLEVLRQLLVS